MKYRTIGQPLEEITADTFKAAAIQANLEAVQSKQETLHRNIATRGLADDAVVPVPDGQGGTRGMRVREFRAQAADEFDRLEKRANRKRGRATVTDEELARPVVEWLRGSRIPQLEQEHLNHAVKRQERQQTLEMAESDPAAPTGTERTQMEVQVKAHKQAMDHLDAMWEIATAELDRYLNLFPDIKADLEAATGQSETSGEPEALKPDAELQPVTAAEVKKATGATKKAG